MSRSPVAFVSVVVLQPKLQGMSLIYLMALLPIKSKKRSCRRGLLLRDINIDNIIIQKIVRNVNSKELRSYKMYNFIGFVSEFVHNDSIDSIFC